MLILLLLLAALAPGLRLQQVAGALGLLAVQRRLLDRLTSLGNLGPGYLLVAHRQKQRASERRVACSESVSGLDTRMRQVH